MKWLTKVRGPDPRTWATSFCPHRAARPRRRLSRSIELPRLLTAPHDVAPDSERQHLVQQPPHRLYIASSIRAPAWSRTTRVPSTAGANPGQHWITVDKNDTVWFSENWSHKLGSFDPKYEEFKHVQLPHFGRPINAPGAGNLALSPDGFIWEARGGVGEQDRSEDRPDRAEIPAAEGEVGLRQRAVG